MKKTWMPIAAGILDILSGAFQVSFFFYVAFYIIMRGPFYHAPFELMLIPASPFTITGTTAIVGGIYVLKMKRKNIVYIGALAAFIPLVLLIPSMTITLGFPQALWAFLPIGIGALILSLRVEKKLKQ